MPPPDPELKRAVDHSLLESRTTVMWTDRHEAPRQCDVLRGNVECDLLIVGGGFSGVWAAIEAKASNPGRDVLLVDAERIGFGASTRNGGFLAESLTHGLSHGLSLWPEEMPTLLRLGRENVREIAAFVQTENIDADLRLIGKTIWATRPHHLKELAASQAAHQKHGEDSELLDREAAQADVHSPTYLGGLRVRSGGGLVDPARLLWGLMRSAQRRGVRILEGTQVTKLRAERAGIRADGASGSIAARQVLLATNAYRPLLGRLRSRVLPIYDHVLATEPLSPDQHVSIGWSENQGLTDAGNQFHYYRRTADDRILWGGYDAIYYFGGQTDAAREQRDESHRLLARHFFTTFPQLRGLRFSHRWAGLIDSTTRFTPVFGTAMSGRVAYAVGFTGLGVGSSRFGARVALDLLAGHRTERTELEMVRRKSFPFPPEPLRYPVVQGTRAALAREDVRGTRGPWLRTLDRFGIGFDS